MNTFANQNSTFANHANHLANNTLAAVLPLSQHTNVPLPPTHTGTELENLPDGSVESDTHKTLQICLAEYVQSENLSDEMVSVIKNLYPTRKEHEKTIKDQYVRLLLNSSYADEHTFEGMTAYEAFHTRNNIDKAHELFKKAVNQKWNRLKKKIYPDDDKKAGGKLPPKRARTWEDEEKDCVKHLKLALDHFDVMKQMDVDRTPKCIFQLLRDTLPQLSPLGEQILQQLNQDENSSSEVDDD